MAKYLVTGGAGFIGSHLVDALLANGHEVAVLDDFSTGRVENVSSAAKVIRANITDPLVVREALAGSNGCFHLAAIASVQRGNEDWLACHKVNQSGTVTVLDAARANGGIPVVYASSAAVYGDTDGAIAVEDRLPAPLTAYGADKLGSELHADIGWRIHRVPSFGCRFFNVYGPRQDPSSSYSGVISIFARRASEGQELIINGDGEQIRDFIHVSDIVAHLLAAMNLLHCKPAAYVANVCTGRGTNVRDLADLIANLAERPTMVRLGPARPGDARHSIGNSDKATALLGIKARVELAEGLKETWDHLSGRLNTHTN